MPFSKPCVCQYKVGIGQLPCFDGPHLLIHLLILHLHFSKGCANQLQDYLQLYNLVAQKKNSQKKVHSKNYDKFQM